MNIRRVQTSIVAERRIGLRLETGHATLPTVWDLHMDPATALVLAGLLESAVHQLCPEGLASPADEPQPLCAS